MINKISFDFVMLRKFSIVIVVWFFEKGRIFKDIFEYFVMVLKFEVYDGSDISVRFVYYSVFLFGVDFYGVVKVFYGDRVFCF